MSVQPIKNIDHAACRTWAHWWKPYDAHKDGTDWVATLKCGRCGSQRVDRINKRGEVVKRHYRMAMGYLRKGDGPLTAEGRAAMRLGLVEIGPAS
jgi:hypothetical protein